MNSTSIEGNQLEDAEDTLRDLGKRLWVLAEWLATTPHGGDCGYDMCLWCYALGGAEGTRAGIVIPALLEIRDYFQEPREQMPDGDTLRKGV
ncbi:MAG TPA: hypothetical protein VJA25_07890 [Dehalococcoidia bacterium]|nr:hypothetical protein [Dehalococcoidia bacterium]